MSLAPNLGKTLAFPRWSHLFSWRSQTVFEKRRQVLIGLTLSTVYAIFAAIALRGFAIVVLGTSTLLTLWAYVRAFVVGRQLIADDLEIEQIVPDPVAPVVLEPALIVEPEARPTLDPDERVRLASLIPPRGQSVRRPKPAFVPADHSVLTAESNRRKRLRAS